MGVEQSTKQPGRPKPKNWPLSWIYKKNPKFSLWLAAVLLVALAFGSGLLVGDGRLHFNFSRQRFSSQNNSLPQDLNYSSVEQVYDALRLNYDGPLDIQKLLEGLKTGLVNASGDRFTEYLNQDSAKDLDEQLNGTFNGIGAELSKEQGMIVIIAPLAGFPAEKAGLKAKDVIIEINGASVGDIGVSEAVQKIRGPAGTSVKLKVIRSGTQELTFDIVRQEIVLPSVESKTLAGNLGYIKISRFAEDTKRLSLEAANKFKGQNVKGLVLDLRGDPGGLLDAAVGVSSIWLGQDKVVLEEKRGDVVINSYKALTGGGQLVGMPTVVLIDGGSASASEITAGALRDNNAATLIGVKSFGKGSVQQLIRLKDGSEVKVTIARWYTPAGKNIDKEGITPDMEVKITDDQIKAGQDPQLAAAVAALSK